MTMTAFQKLRDTLQALPVHSIIAAVSRDVLDGKVTIVAARTGSGKSMMLPSALADATDDQVVVLVPRRFLATDAACNVAELSGTTLGDEVGFAIGQVNGEKSLHTPNTKVLYCTYGYALRSGLINTARTIVLDEVHEGDEHISLARAVLYERKKTDHALRILEMSATVNASAQAAHWQGAATTAIHKAKGSEHACDILSESPMGNREHEGRSIEEVVIGLLKGTEHKRETIAATSAPSHGTKEDFATLFAPQTDNLRGNASKGIAVFRGGVKEVERTVDTLKDMLRKEGIMHVEVVGIHSGTPSDERRAARLAPKQGWRKIIVGTNVIESGVNLRWVDAGVSDGVRKLPHHRDDTGADALVPDDLPQSGITQQMGRINRDPKATGFARGIFILHAKNKFDERTKQNGPAIERESMLEPAFHAACLGYNPTRLNWDIGNVHTKYLPTRLEQAREELVRLELIDEDWSLTKQGKFINHLPVSPETGAMLNEARLLDESRMREGKPPRVLGNAVIIAAIAENRGIKLNSKKHHGSDRECTSDLIDAMNAYRAIRVEAEKQNILAPVLEASNESALATAGDDALRTLQKNRMALGKICAEHNVSANGFIQVAQLVAEISKRLTKTSGINLKASAEDEKYDHARYNELKRCILNGRVNQFFQAERHGLRDLLRDYGTNKRDNGRPYNGYQRAESSIVTTPPNGAIMTGYLREVTPKCALEKAGEIKQVKKSRKQGGDQETEPLLVVSNLTIIPPEVFIAWARGRAERHQPIVSEANVSASATLEGTYAGKARFELALSPEARNDAGYFVEHMDEPDALGVEYGRHTRRNKPYTNVRDLAEKWVARPATKATSER